MKKYLGIFQRLKWSKLLSRMFERNGRIDAQAVVDEAKPADSPIHNCFEWNDNAAANEYRKWHA